MTNLQVCEAFARGAAKGHSLNVFIDGDTIYSYGYHFPMASWKDGQLFITYRTYSNSTSKQMGYLQRALGYPKDAILVFDPRTGATKDDLKYWEDQRKQSIAKMDRARTESMKRVWLDTAHKASHQIASILIQLGLTVSELRLATV